jgi:hypothetical protein
MISQGDRIQSALEEFERPYRIGQVLDVSDTVYWNGRWCPAEVLETRMAEDGSHEIYVSLSLMSKKTIAVGPSFRDFFFVICGRSNILAGLRCTILGSTRAENTIVCLVWARSPLASNCTDNILKVNNRVYRQAESLLIQIRHFFAAHISLVKQLMTRTASPLNRRNDKRH